MEPALPRDTFEDLWKTVDIINRQHLEEQPDGISLETRIAVIRNANLQYCIANHLV